ncbi:NAD(P)-binding protein [Dyadobacter flavalbus]|uniref:NAD(P)-binding protein n=1 Tax=Dyadobacter flavalbus TaxID=2579942 RepID=A0A5M8QXN2_9BACT|nr:FAD-dependent monooxygenase [Dyadobacter flavalbus]KAA6440949.1 NAD(P)-binding protein [Dyadobacter flavalbus]
MTVKDKEIAIIGGGIAGLTFAICLKNNGYKCHIFEKKPAFKEIGAAISVFPNALRVFQAEKIMREIIASGGEITKIFMKTDKGRILAKSEPKYELPAICIHRADLHSILLKNTPAELHANHDLKSLQNLNNGKVRLAFTNGFTKEFDAVIGADGIHSVVRQFLIDDGKPVFRGYNIWRGVIDTNFDIGYASETYGKGKRVGIVPIKNGKYGWWATCNEALSEDDQPEGTKKKLQRLFGDWHYPIPDLISSTENIIKNSLSDRIPVKGWTKGNITLLGDAAHPTTPNLGQGGCLAIEGAYILANAIKKYGITQKAFQIYEELQFPRAKLIVETSLKVGEMGQIENSAAVFFRNLALKFTPSSVSLKMIDKFFSYDVTELKI